MQVVVLALIVFALFFSAFYQEPDVSQRVGIRFESGKGVDVDYKIKIEGDKVSAVIKLD